MTPSTCVSASPPSLFLLDAAGELKPAVTLGQGLPPRVSGLPAFYFWKDAIVVGSYVHPAGKFSLEITRDKLDGYARTFGKMKSNGVAVPILMDHAQSAAATLGWIIDVKRRDDRLMELHQFLGESARDIGLRNKVSLGIDPDYVDGKGNRYGEAIVHSAVTPVPVVPNQEGYEAVEMGRSGAEVITLSLVESEHSTSNAQLPTLNAEERTSNVQLPTSNVEGGTPGEVATPSAGNVELQLAMSALAEAAAAKRDLAVARGGIDPSVAQELFSLLVGPKDGAAMWLSRVGGGAPIALAVFDALARNRPVPLGEVTSLQVLSRLVPGMDPELATLQERMIALASGAAARS